MCSSDLIVLFDESGAVVRRVVLDHRAGVLAVDIAAGTYHGLVALEPGTVLLEAKAGPYLPTAGAEWGAFAPPEGDSGAAAYVAELERGFA